VLIPSRSLFPLFPLLLIPFSLLRPDVRHRQVVGAVAGLLAPEPRPTTSPAAVAGVRRPTVAALTPGLLVGPSPSQAPSLGRRPSRKGSWTCGGGGKEAAAAAEAAGRAGLYYSSIGTTQGAGTGHLQRLRRAPARNRQSMSGKSHDSMAGVAIRGGAAMTDTSVPPALAAAGGMEGEAGDNGD